MVSDHEHEALKAERDDALAEAATARADRTLVLRWFFALLAYTETDLPEFFKCCTGSYPTV